jgi:RuvB-like protein 1
MRSIQTMSPTPLLWHRYAIQLLTPASILARLAGRDQIEIEDIGEMNELFLDAKTSASLIGQSGDYAT